MRKVFWEEMPVSVPSPVITLGWRLALSIGLLALAVLIQAR